MFKTYKVALAQILAQRADPQECPQVNHVTHARLTLWKSISATSTAVTQLFTKRPECSEWRKAYRGKRRRSRDAARRRNVKKRVLLSVRGCLAHTNGFIAMDQTSAHSCTPHRISHPAI